MLRISLALLVVACLASVSRADTQELSSWASHDPPRPLPRASERPLEADVPNYFVHPVGGDDANAGTENKPWRTIGHAVKRIKAGDTLVLRGGTYYEHVTASLVGTADKPITIRAYPGELAILDGGLWDFQNQAVTAWEPCPGGAAGEFRSTKAYPGLDADAGDGPAVFGNFGDSWLPLQAYRFHGDLKSDNPWWNVDNKVGGQDSVYCGPGIYYDPETGRIHCRLAHTKLPGLHEDNYTGETDPTKLSLVIAGGNAPPLRLERSQNVRLYDLVLRGSRVPTLQVHDSRNIMLDGLSAYGGSSAMQVRDTWGLRMQHCDCRGIGAPWTFRGMLKYRSVEARIFNASHWDPTGIDNRDFEIRYCEFTDSVDGVFVGNIRGLRFHHNLIENVTDDGMFLTAGTAYDGHTHGGDMHIYQNRFARILTTFAFGVGHGRQKAIDLGLGATGRQTGSGAYIFRNVFDLRRPVWYTWPSGPDAEQEITSRGRFASDHGGPTWEPMWIYHNTILAGGTPRYDYGCDGLGHGLAFRNTRRVFNNIVCLTEGTPGSTLPPPEADFQADGNLFWSLKPDKPLTDDLFAKFRASPAYERSKKEYPAGWTTHDVFADPRLEQLSGDWAQYADVGLAKGSPAVNAGIELSKDWPDAQLADSGQPDSGAIPDGIASSAIGVNGRLDIGGKPLAAPVAEEGVREETREESWIYAIAPDRDDAAQPRALIVEGYPAFDSPIVAYLLRKAGWQVDIRERAWVDPAEWSAYKLVIYDGSMGRAGLEKTAFDEADLQHVRAYLENGGTLVMMRERTSELFRPAEGRKLLADIFGQGAASRQPLIEIQQPKHPWLASLAARSVGGKKPAAEPRFPDEKTGDDKSQGNQHDDLPWLAKGSPISIAKGENLIGSKAGESILARGTLGKGQLIYVGWSPAASIPHGREKSTVELETTFEQQVAILNALLTHAPIANP
jgi:hypothetical protein